MSTVQYVSDENGTPTAVIIPIELWRKLLAGHETTDLLRHDEMKQHFLPVYQRSSGFNLNNPHALRSTPYQYSNPFDAATESTDWDALA